VDPRLPAQVTGDPSRFRQVLINLMGNAAKFTASGEILLFLDLAEESETRVKLHAKVIDTGVGIPPDRLSAIFRPFEQGRRHNHPKPMGVRAWGSRFASRSPI
jgi:two-component system, sensor histidine kinase and response regulator